MDYNEYYQSSQLIAHLLDKGDYDDALSLIRRFIESDISDLDKSMMCVNMAVVYDRLGQVEQVLDWYDRGIEYEYAHRRFFVAEQKAAYLAGKGRKRESLTMYEKLEKESSMTEYDKERIRQNIALLRGSSEGG